MSSVAEGVPKHISRDSRVNLKRKAFFLKNSWNVRFNICLLPALVTSLWTSELLQCYTGLDAWLNGDGAPSTGNENKGCP